MHVFPETIAKLVHELSIKYKFPADFSIASILYCCSVAIRKNYKVKIKDYWTESANLYVCIVAPPGTAKTPVLAFFTRELSKKDAENHKLFIKEFEAYELKKKAATKKQPFNDAPPNWQQLLLTDFTIEALTRVLKNNTKGVGVYAEELSGFFAQWKRYSTAGDAQKYLSFYSGQALPINRAGSAPVYIEDPFVSIFGGMQPKILAATFTPELLSNGTVDRFLYSYPENIKKEIAGNDELSEGLYESYIGMINYLLSFDNQQPLYIEFTIEAKKKLHDFRQGIANAVNDANERGNERLAGILNKFEYHLIRLSLIMQVMADAINKQNSTKINIDAVSAAMELCKYFMHHAGRVIDLIEDNPTAALPEDKQRLYEALPEEFTTAKGLEIAMNQKPKVPERTFKRFLDDDMLFVNLSRGQYRKRFTSATSATSATMQ